MGEWRHGRMETWENGYMGEWRHGKMETLENGVKVRGGH